MTKCPCIEMGDGTYTRGSIAQRLSKMALHSFVRKRGEAEHAHELFQIMGYT